MTSFVAGNDPGDVLDRLAFSDGNVRRPQVKGMASHAKKTRFKGDSCPCRRLGENHGHAAILEGLVVFASLEARLDFPGKVKGGMDFFGGKIGDV